MKIMWEIVLGVESWRLLYRAVSTLLLEHHSWLEPVAAVHLVID
jgi:hypothetical protein